MDLGISGRTALVTGSTAGIGYAIAETLAREGVVVTLNGRDADRLARAVERLRAAVPAARLDSVVGDVASEQGAAAVIAHRPQVDILVNNVAGIAVASFFASTDDQWRVTFEGTVLSGVRMARHYAPGMRDRGWGRIIFISSESGFNIPVEFIHYGAAKAAQIAAARGIAMELKASGVTCNSVLPGPTRTERMAGRYEVLAQQQGRTVESLEAELFETRRQSSLIRRLATPQETANLVAFVAGEGSSAITGASLRVEGGVVNFL